MKLYYAIQILRVILMCSGSTDGVEGASRSCAACTGYKSGKICQLAEVERIGLQARSVSF